MRYKWGIVQQHVITMRHCTAMLNETDCGSCDGAHGVKRWKNRKRRIITISNEKWVFDKQWKWEEHYGLCSKHLKHSLTTSQQIVQRGGGMNPLYSKWFNIFGLLEIRLAGSLSEFRSGWFNIGIRNQVVILEGFCTLSDIVGQWDSDSSSSSKTSCLQLGQCSMRLRKPFCTNHRERYNSAWGKPESNL